MSRKTGLSTLANWSFANFKGSYFNIYLIGANGVDPVQVYDGATVPNLFSNASASENYVVQIVEHVWLMIGNDKTSETSPTVLATISDNRTNALSGGFNKEYMTFFVCDSDAKRHLVLQSNNTLDQASSSGLCLIEYLC